jgi:hypothetical protein
MDDLHLYMRYTLRTTIEMVKLKPAFFNKKDAPRPTRVKVIKQQERKGLSFIIKVSDYTPFIKGEGAIEACGVLIFYF